MASTDFLNKAYLAYFGRPIDPTGGQAFSMAAEDDVEVAFAASAESKSLYGSEIQANFVNAVYNNLFGRDAEDSGVAYWLNEYNRGAVSAAEMALSILNGARNSDAEIIDNKLAASLEFYERLDTPKEISGYTTMEAAAVARDFLATISLAPVNDEVVDSAIAAAASVVANELDHTFFNRNLDETFQLGAAGDNVGNGSYSNDSEIVDLYANDKIVFFGEFGDDAVVNFTLDTDNWGGEATAGFDMLDFSGLVNGGSFSIVPLISGTNTSAAEVATRFVDDRAAEESVYIAYGLDNVAAVYHIVDGSLANDLDVSLLGTIDLGDDVMWFQLAAAINSNGTDSLIF